MATIEGRGQLQHHFWGEYSATIMLQFATAADATEAQASAFPMFKPFAKVGVLQFHGTGDALKAAEAALVAHGADQKKIESVAKSIDFGEPFTVSVKPGPDPNQQSLFIESHGPKPFKAFRQLRESDEDDGQYGLGYPSRKCTKCNGTGWIPAGTNGMDQSQEKPCTVCKGTGRIRVIHESTAPFHAGQEFTIDGDIWWVLATGMSWNASRGDAVMSVRLVNKETSDEMTVPLDTFDSLHESTPPGMEDWVTKAKPHFEKEYGDDWEQYLYATAWKLHKAKG